MPNKTFLDKVEMFAGLSQQDLLKLQEIVAERTYRKDEVIFHADDPGSTLFILKSGAVKISVSDSLGREDILKVLYPTDFFGEMSILDGQHRSATVSSVEKSTALIIQREQFVSLISRRPQIALNMLALMSRRIRKADAKIASLRFDNAFGKVARVLLDFAAEQERKTDGRPVIDLKLTRQEMADLAGMSRETFTKTLMEFRNSGCIKMDGRSITIMDESAMRREMR